MALSPCFRGPPCFECSPVLRTKREKKRCGEFRTHAACWGSNGATGDVLGVQRHFDSKGRDESPIGGDQGMTGDDSDDSYIPHRAVEVDEFLDKVVAQSKGSCSNCVRHAWMSSTCP